MTVIIKETGSLFDEPVEAIVNAVNCVGVSGKGIALEFRRQFPHYQTAYENACFLDMIKPGQCHLWRGEYHQDPRYIISFPTKVHWRQKSQGNFIINGVRSLVDMIAFNQITTVAMPAVGCGEGGLHWDGVLILLVKYLTPIDCVVTVFVPGAEKRQ